MSVQEDLQTALQELRERAVWEGRATIHYPIGDGRSARIILDGRDNDYLSSYFLDLPGRFIGDCDFTSLVNMIVDEASSCSSREKALFFPEETNIDGERFPAPSKYDPILGAVLSGRPITRGVIDQLRRESVSVAQDAKGEPIEMWFTRYFGPLISYLYEVIDHQQAQIEDLQRRNLLDDMRDAYDRRQYEED